MSCHDDILRITGWCLIDAWVRSKWTWIKFLKTLLSMGEHIISNSIANYLKSLGYRYQIRLIHPSMVNNDIIIWNTGGQASVGQNAQSVLARKPSSVRWVYLNLTQPSMPVCSHGYHECWDCVWKSKFSTTKYASMFTRLWWMLTLCV